MDGGKRGEEGLPGSLGFLSLQGLFPKEEITKVKEWYTEYPPK